MLITNWWQKIEQQSLIYSLEFSHLLHTDIANCYGSLYTHSIAWAIHGVDEAKKHKKPKNKNDDLLGNKIDKHIRAGRYGHTNGISQGSVLMDFIAELVLGYADETIDTKLKEEKENARILRYRDDYRIFTHTSGQAEKILKTISNCLQEVGMTLNTAKTVASSNIIESSIKPDKLAAIKSQYFREKREKRANVQMQLLRLHAFGQQFTNSGALQRLISEFDNDQITKNLRCSEIEVLIAIATDIAFISPKTFPTVAKILSQWLSLVPDEQKQPIWEKIQKKIRRIPYNGYMEIWLQRIAKPKPKPKPKPKRLKFKSNEPICQIVDGKPASLWENCWLQNGELKEIMDDASKVIDKDKLDKLEKIIQLEEVELFNQYS